MLKEGYDFKGVLSVAEGSIWGRRKGWGTKAEGWMW